MTVNIGGTVVIDGDKNFSNVGILTVGSGSSTITFGKGDSPMIIGTGVTIGFGTVHGELRLSGIVTAGQLSTPLSVG